MAVGGTVMQGSTEAAPVLRRRGGYPRAVLHGLLPVVLGGLIYVAWRPPSLRLFHWLQVLHLERGMALWRDLLGPLQVPGWLVYNVPDGLWLYALGWWTALLWRGQTKPERWVWLLAPVALAWGSEIAQGLGMLEGTFDPLDLLFYACAAALAWLAHSQSDQQVNAHE